MSEKNTRTLFEEFVKIIARLRDPNGGCPWDLKQTHTSLKPYLIEESYEVLDAIDNNPDKLHEELGDVLLQVVLHSQLATDDKRFTIDDVVKAISEKIVKRHPHVFGDVKADDAATVLRNWEEIKQKELKAEQSILDGVPRGMPALLRAQRVGEKAARVGFEWKTIEDVRDKVFEELREFLECSCEPDTDRSRLTEEFGDLLFSLTQLARRLDFQTEELLHTAIDKFSSRFKKIEKLANRPLKELTLEAQDALWEKVKKEEKAQLKEKSVKKGK